MKAFFSKIKHQQINDEIDESQCKKLSKLFTEERFQDVVGKAEKFLLKSYKGTYKQFLDEVKATQKTSCCLTSWNTPTLSGVCLDCQKNDSSCLCISCFLAKKHDQHHSYIIYFPSGSCDCGDPSYIKPSGFCSHHPGPDQNPDVTQMTEENRKKFITVFRAAFTGAIQTQSVNNSIRIIEYIKEFVPLGDGLRRCVAYAIVPVAKKSFHDKIQKCNSNLTGSFVSLFGLLTSDLYFRDRMSVICFRNYIPLLNIIASHIFNDKMKSPSYLSLHCYFDFVYHYFSEHSIMYAINKESFNWPNFLIDFIGMAFSPIEVSNFNYDKNFEGGTFNQFCLIAKFLKIVVRFDEQHSNIQKFIDQYSKLLVRIERMIYFAIRTTPEDSSDEGYTSYEITLSFSVINKTFSFDFKDSSPQNKQFSLDQPFKCLLEFLDRTDPKPLSVLNAQERCPISTFITLHTLFFTILAGYKNPKDELKSLCDANKVSFDYFCCRVVIYPLRVLAAFFMYPKFSNINAGHRLSIRFLLRNSAFNTIFGLVQMILSICENKSKIMNAILTTFGVFDDISLYKGKLNEYEYERQKNLFDLSYFDCSIFLLCLLTDSSILSFDEIRFNRLRVIELLKRSRATAGEIEEHVNEKFHNKIFVDSLLDYIERVINKKGGSYFRLKNEGDFTPFFPAIKQKDRIEILMKFTNQLIPVPDCIDLPERGMSLKECFKTPQFYCLCFRLLTSPQSNLTMKQVGLAMCDCIIKNTTQFPPESYKDENPVSVSASSLNELIQNASENVQLKDTNLLTCGFQLENCEKTSLIKRILMQENLGKLFIEKNGLPADLGQKEDTKNQAERERTEQLIKEKKAKAMLLKQRLMKDFNNRRKQFTDLSSSQIKQEEKQKEQEQKEKEAPQQNNNDSNSNNNLKIESDESEEFNSSQNVLTDEFNNVLCNVCLTSQDDIFGVPCLSLPSILYSIIDNKLHKHSKPLDEHVVTYQMNVCRHCLHYKCFVKLLSEAVKEDESSKTFHCMMDRGIRNCFLPIFEGEDEEEDLLLKKPPVIMRVAINDFIRRAFEEKAAADLLLPLRSFAAAVSIFEVRLRRRPDVLDSPTVPILLRNLLLTIYHGLHARVAKSDLEEKCKDDKLLLLIFKFVQSEDPKNEFRSIVKQVSKSIKKKSTRYNELLRRAAIIEDIALNTSSKSEPAPFVDWDEVLSDENLIERFDLKSSSSSSEHSAKKLKKFKTIKLPKKFIGLYQQPYNIDICDSSIEKVIDLLTGKVVVVTGKEYVSYDTSKYKTIDEYEKDVYKGGLALYLVLTKDKASSLMFHSAAAGKFWMNDSIYVDKFGDTDHGFKRGLITKLSKDKLEIALDKFMSGEITLYE